MGVRLSHVAPSAVRSLRPDPGLPWLLDMYRSGKLRLDEVITTRFGLYDIMEGYADLHAGVNIRDVIDH